MSIWSREWPHSRILGTRRSRSPHFSRNRKAEHPENGKGLLFGINQNFSSFEACLTAFSKEMEISRFMVVFTNQQAFLYWDQGGMADHALRSSASLFELLISQDPTIFPQKECILVS